jgi:hypothetical protein
MSEEELDDKIRSILKPQPAISSHQVYFIALLAIGIWTAISVWMLNHSPSEAERAGIQKAAETIATAAFFYYLGSSAGSRNKDRP